MGWGRCEVGWVYFYMRWDRVGQSLSFLKLWGCGEGAGLRLLPPFQCENSNRLWSTHLQGVNTTSHIPLPLLFPLGHIIQTFKDTLNLLATHSETRARQQYSFNGAIIRTNSTLSIYQISCPCIGTTSVFPLLIVLNAPIIIQGSMFSRIYLALNDPTSIRINVVLSFLK